MSCNILNQFKEVWALDFEFNQSPGNLPIVRCMVAKELRSGRTIRLWADQLSQLAAPPFEVTSLAIGFLGRDYHQGNLR